MTNLLTQFWITKSDTNFTIIYCCFFESSLHLPECVWVISKRIENGWNLQQRVTNLREAVEELVRLSISDWKHNWTTTNCKTKVGSFLGNKILSNLWSIATSSSYVHRISILWIISIIKMTYLSIQYVVGNIQCIANDKMRNCRWCLIMWTWPMSFFDHTGEE